MYVLLNYDISVHIYFHNYICLILIFLQDIELAGFVREQKVLNISAITS